MQCQTDCIENNRITSSSPFNPTNTLLMRWDSVGVSRPLCPLGCWVLFGRYCSWKQIDAWRHNDKLGHEMREAYSVITFFLRLSVRPPVCLSLYIMYFRYDTKILQLSNFVQNTLPTRVTRNDLIWNYFYLCNLCFKVLSKRQDLTHFLLSMKSQNNHA